MAVSSERMGSKGIGVDRELESELLGGQYVTYGASGGQASKYAIHEEDSVEEASQHGSITYCKAFLKHRGDGPRNIDSEI